MVKADFSGDYVNTENTHDNDIMTIVGPPVYNEIKVQKNGKEVIKTVVNIPVEVNQKAKIYTPSKDSGTRLVKAFGDEMDKWIGKQLKASIVNYKSFGVTKQTIDTYPIVEEKI